MVEATAQLLRRRATGRNAMARSASLTISTSATRLALGFVAGFLATLTFHQIGIWVLHAVGYIPFAAWNTAPKPPFAVPGVICLSFWGGVWGILLLLIEGWVARVPRGDAGGPPVCG